ncbi:hypothetical protein QOT17_018191 [Balamuthia mandrillaris]
MGLITSLHLLALLSVVSLIICTYVASAQPPFAQIEGEGYLAEWPHEGPSVRLFPKSPNGAPLREESFGWDVLSFQEKADCYCCREDGTLGFKAVVCDDFEGLGPFVDLRTNASWHLEEHIPGKKISWTTLEFSGEAVLTFTFEDISEDRVVPMSNGIETRELKFSKGGLKFSINITNYSPLMFNITEEPERYYGLTMMNRFFLSRPVHNTSLGVFSLGPASKFGQYQIPLVIRTVDEPLLSVTFIQTTFAVQDPPSGSRQVLPESSWGFEDLEAIQRDWYEVDGKLLGQDFELIFGGSRSIYYDPDLTILFGGEAQEDGEEDGAEEDGADEVGEHFDHGGEDDEDDGKRVAVPVAVSLGGAALLVVSVVAAYFVVHRWRLRRERRESAVVNF